MNHEAIAERINIWLEPTKRRLSRAADSSPALRILFLVLGNLAGFALMLSPPLTMGLSAALALAIAHHAQGPLDWVLFATLGAVSLLSGYVSVQFYFIRPSGMNEVPITSQQAPELFDILARQVVDHKIHPVDQVFITPDAGLRIQVVPKGLVPVFHEYALIVGAPLLFFLTPAQFRLAVARAVAETALRQKGISGWAVKTAEDWPAIVQALEARSTPLANFLLRPATWVADLTGALAKDLRSNWQQSATESVLKNADEQTAKDYLSNQVIALSFLERRFWPIIFRAAERYPKPAVTPFSQFETILQKGISGATARRWLRQAEATRGTEPLALRDILSNLGFDGLRWSQPPESNTYHRLFSSPAVLQRLDKFWQHAIEPEWSRRHASFQRENRLFENLHLKAHLHSLRGTAAIGYVQLATRFLDKQQAIAICRETYRANLDSAAVCFACGREMLSAGQVVEGCEALQRAADLDSLLTDRAFGLIREHKQGHLGDRARFGATAQLA